MPLTKELREAFSWLSALIVALALLLSPGCKSRKAPSKEEAPPPELNLPACQPQKSHPGLAPHVRPEMLAASYWIAKMTPEQASAQLLRSADIRKLNQAIASQELGVRLLPEALSEDATKKQSSAFHIEQQAFVHQKLKSQSYVESIPGATARADEIVKDLIPRDDYFVFSTATQLRCWPIEGGMFKPPIDRDFDRNNCTTLGPTHLLHRIVSTREDNWHYVQGEFVEGWVQNPRWQAISGRELRKRKRLPRRWVTLDQSPVQAGGKSGPMLSMGNVLRVGPRNSLAWPGAKGWKKLRLSNKKGVRRKPLPFQRDLVFKQVFDQLDQPYGWGGRDGHRDCSRLLLDAFAVFGIRLPRWSGHQAEITNSVDVSMLSPRDKRATIRRFAQSNILLLYMPGHIMLYLGHEGERDYAISSISEFVTPCKKSKSGELAEQIHRLDRVTVTDLSLGEGAPRRSFLERITKMVRL